MPLPSTSTNAKGNYQFLNCLSKYFCAELQQDSKANQEALQAGVVGLFCVLEKGQAISGGKLKKIFIKIISLSDHIVSPSSVYSLIVLVEPASELQSLDNKDAPFFIIDHKPTFMALMRIGNMPLSSTDSTERKSTSFFSCNPLIKMNVRIQDWELFMHCNVQKVGVMRRDCASHQTS